MKLPHKEMGHHNIIVGEKNTIITQRMKSNDVLKKGIDNYVRKPRAKIIEFCPKIGGLGGTIDHPY
jgi:hypothetical protein